MTNNNETKILGEISSEVDLKVKMRFIFINYLWYTASLQIIEGQHLLTKLLLISC